MSGPATLANTLLEVTETEYVRFVADWLCRANNLDQAPALTGNRIVDTLTAAAAAHAAMTHGEPIPTWTSEPDRTLDQLWYPGPPGLFAYALVNSPLPFVNRGVLVEANSLTSL